MKYRSIAYLILWIVVGILLVRSCVPEEEPPPEVLQGFRPDTFDAPDAPPEQRFTLENEYLIAEWTNRGAGCTLVKLKDYTKMAMPLEEAGREDFYTHYSSVIAQPPAAGQAAGNRHHRRRDGLRLFEPAGRLGVDLDAADWQVEGPEITATGGQRLSFRLTSPTGVALVKEVRLEPGARQFDCTVSVEPTAEVAPELVGDLHLRLATGGGVTAEPDRFYQNPYSAAARLDRGEIDELKVLHPNGKLPPRRDAAARWNGQMAYVLEGSKYFLSAIRPVERPFLGAVAEVLFDQLFYEAEVFSSFPPEQQEQLIRIADAGGRLFESLGRTASIEELAAETGLTASQVQSLLFRQQAVTAGMEAKGFPGAWRRTSVAGDFKLHVGGAGTAAESRSFQWYLGPKDPKVLKQEPYQTFLSVVRDVDYGGSFFYRMFFTRTIAPLILGILKTFQALVSNWGVAIILMTLLVRAVLFPINRTSQVKMAEYQAKVAKIKPKLDEINQKFKDDPQRKQQETLKLYQEHKIRPPLGGCLPILLQFPIFIGLFAALRCSILLRQQPFILWVEDLARPDALVDFGGPIASIWPLSGVTTLNILPVIMVVLWVWHQRSMPRPTDPQQAQVQKMMTFMPILFGVMLYNYAAGLSLYMITSSAVGIFETKVIKKRWPVKMPGAGDSEES